MINRLWQVVTVVLARLTGQFWLIFGGKLPAASTFFGKSYRENKKLFWIRKYPKFVLEVVIVDYSVFKHLKKYVSFLQKNILNKS